jgi:Cu(I)/Ag(I) efflux system membrane fusion protein
MTRTLHLPIQINNKDHKLKMGMYVSAIIKATLGADGQAVEPGIEGKYTCPMHPQIIKDEPGNCPICEMPLVKVLNKETSDKIDSVKLLAVPVSAVLDSGARKIVYVAKSKQTFELREVILGPRSGDAFPVLKGLILGERVVTRGGFFIDSQFQIMGSPSLYYQGGLQADSKHKHSDTEKVTVPIVPKNEDDQKIKSNSSHQHK